MSSDRKRYSPPERGIAALTAEYAVAPARAITPPTAQAARIVPGSRSWAMKPVLKNTPAPIMLATTRPTPGHSPSSLRSRGTRADGTQSCLCRDIISEAVEAREWCSPVQEIRGTGHPCIRSEIQEGTMQNRTLRVFVAVSSVLLSSLATAQDVDVPGNLTMVGSTDKAGNILKDGVPFLHNFGQNNTFLGNNAGNLTMSGDSNTGAGSGALRSNTFGTFNTATGRD